MKYAAATSPSATAEATTIHHGMSDCDGLASVGTIVGAVENDGTSVGVGPVAGVTAGVGSGVWVTTA